MGNIAKYLIIDGSALMHRAYHALPLFYSQNGTPTNVLHGFIKMTLSLLAQFEPVFVSVAFDTPKPTFRKKLLISYQAQRPKAPDEYKIQVPLVQQFLALAKIKNYALEGYEADDVISTLVNLACQNKPELQIYIVTGDKDLLQLVNQQITVLMPKSGVSNLFFMDESAVERKLGIKPSQVVDYKTLVGDSSDNYSGVKGIGPKTATKLLNRYQTISNLYCHLDDLEPALRQKFADNKEQVKLSQQLAQLVNHLNINFKLEDSLLPSLSLNSGLVDFCDQYNLKTLKNQLTKMVKTTTKQKAVDKQAQDQLSFF